MMPLNILLINVNGELAQLIESQLALLDASNALTEDMFEPGSHYDLIVLGASPGETLLETFFTIKEQSSKSQKIVLVSHDGTYNVVRNAFREGAYDYWLKPYHPENIAETLQTIVAKAYEKTNLPEIKKRIQNSIIGVSQLDRLDLEIFYNHTIDSALDKAELYLNCYDMFVDLLIPISFEPLPLTKTAIAQICSRWIVEHEDFSDALYRVVKKMGFLYQDIFFPNIHSVIVRQAIHEVLAPTHHNITVKFIAHRLYTNQSHLSITFKRYTGISLSDYIKYIKINGAMLMLMDQDYLIDDIMNIIGYKDEHYFSKIFKDKTGLFPSSYRRVNHKYHFKKE